MNLRINVFLLPLINNQQNARTAYKHNYHVDIILAQKTILVISILIAIRLFTFRISSVLIIHSEHVTKFIVVLCRAYCMKVAVVSVQMFSSLGLVVLTTGCAVL